MKRNDRYHDAPRIKSWATDTPGVDFVAALMAGIAVLWALRALLPSEPPGSALNLSVPLFLRFAVFFPVVEEFLFRDVLQGALARTTWGSRRVTPFLSAANLATSVIFAAAHLLSHPPLWAASVFFPSLLFGYFKDRYHTLTRCTLLHIFYNAGYCVLFFHLPL